jgi:hypothetical protein
MNYQNWVIMHEYFKIFINFNDWMPASYIRVFVVIAHFSQKIEFVAKG